MNENYSWFKENYTKLQQKYGDCFLVIKNKAVIGQYQTYGEAVHITKKTEKLGTFIVQECHSTGKIYQVCIASMNFS